MKKPKHHFYLESSLDKDNNQLIFLNFNYGYKEYKSNHNKFSYKSVKISSRWSINKKFWIGKPSYRANRSYTIKFGKEINTVLEKMETAAYTCLSNFRIHNEKDPTPTELKNLILISLERNKPTYAETNISEYLKNLIQKRTSLPKTSTDFWGKSTKKNYDNFLNHIFKYESHKNLNLTFDQLNEDIYWDYFKTINQIHFKETGAYYTLNSIAKECKNLKSILNCAKDDEINIGFNFSKKKYKIHALPSPKYEAILNEDELLKIIKTKTPHSKTHTHAKNYIIISALTGLRISDVIHLHKIDPEIIKHNKTQHHIFTTKIRKSKDNLSDLITTIPIPKHLINLMNLNNGRFPKFPSEQVLRRHITDFLKYLNFDKEREVITHYYLAESQSKHIPFYEDFSPHNCRSSFITNLKQLGIQEETIKPITHPSSNFTSILSLYDKSSMRDKSITFIKELNSKNSKIFNY